MAVSISRQLIEAARRHLSEETPLNELNITQSERNRIERVKYVRFLAEKEPKLDAFERFKRIAAGRYDTAMDEWREAKKDAMLFETLEKMENEK